MKSNDVLHAREVDANHYLIEIARALKTAGHAVISIHCNPKGNKNFSGTDERMDIDQNYFYKELIEPQHPRSS